MTLLRCFNIVTGSRKGESVTSEDEGMTYYPCYVEIIFWYTILKRILIKLFIFSCLTWSILRFHIPVGFKKIKAARRDVVPSAPFLYRFGGDFFGGSLDFQGGRVPGSLTVRPWEFIIPKWMHSSNHHFLGQKCQTLGGVLRQRPVSRLIVFVH